MHINRRKRESERERERETASVCMPGLHAVFIVNNSSHRKTATNSLDVTPFY